MTQALWRAVANAATEERESIPFKILDPSPSTFQSDMLPVEQISWYDTKVFIQKLNHLTKETRPFGYKYRLPTEAEWEYSARGGKYHGDEYKYSGSDRIKDVGWFIDNSRNETKPPALKGSNQLNIYDMTGNVWEWCEDEWHSNYIGAPIDGSAWIVHNQRDMKRVNRGGRWKSISIRCRISSRSGWPAQARTLNVGFRLALSLQRTKKPDGVH